MDQNNFSDDKKQQNLDPLDSEIESKLTVATRQSGRAHSTEHFGEEDAITDINVTPLVDVALVLVIIFMAVSPFLAQANLKVLQSQEGAAKGKASIDENVQVLLDKNQKLFVNGTEISIETLKDVLKEKLPKSKDGLVTVQADSSNLVGQVVEIMDIAKQSGAKKVAILNK